MAIRSAGVVMWMRSSGGSSPRRKQAIRHAALAAARCSASFRRGSTAITEDSSRVALAADDYLNTMLAGLPVWMTWPVGVSAPVAGSARKAMMVSLFWLAT